MLLGKSGGQFVHYLSIRFSSWLDNTHEELWWDTESKDTINESSHDLQVEKSIEQLLEVVEAGVHDLHVIRVLVSLKFGEKLHVLVVLITVEIEKSRLESILFENSYIVSSLISHDSDSPELVSIWVIMSQVLVTIWNNTWHVHKLFMLLELELEFLLNNCFLLLFILNSGVREDHLLGSLLPVFKIILVEIDQE